MESSKPAVGSPDRRQTLWQVVRAAASWDLYVACALGVAAAGATLDKAIRTAAVPIVITEAAIGVALTATVFGALAVFATFFDSGYRRVLDLAGGFRSALRPYAIVGVVSAAAGVAGVGAALVLPALGRVAAAIVVGVSSLLCAWSLAGCISLVELTMFHATERARLMAGADDAARALAERRRARAS